MRIKVHEIPPGYKIKTGLYWGGFTSVGWARTERKRLLRYNPKLPEDYFLVYEDPKNLGKGLVIEKI